MAKSLRPFGVVKRAYDAPKGVARRGAPDVDNLCAGFNIPLSYVPMSFAYFQEIVEEDR